MDTLKKLCWPIATLCIACIINISSVRAQHGGGGLVQGVNDNNTIHESPLQTAIEVGTWLIVIRILALYKLP